MIPDVMLQAHGQIADRPTEEQAQRLAVVQEALTWLGTPYHTMARVKGAGVDCGMILAEVFHQAGVVPQVDVEAYPADWHLHRGEERYLGVVEQFAGKVDREPLPGDLVLYKFGRCISHGAVVVAWPLIVHAYVRRGVVLDDAERNLDLEGRLAGTWSVWGEV